jgi:branched-chain amino acid transport system substrate-binding protein
MSGASRGVIGVGVAAAALLAFAASFGAAAAAVSCKKATIAVMAPLSGPAASIGQEQQHWAQFAVFLNNQTRRATKVSLQSFDTQLDDTMAATQAAKIAGTSQVLAVVGPAVSDEATAASPAFTKARLAFISGSATKTSLTSGDDRLPTFFRTVATDYAQSQTDADFIRKTLKATKVWIVDDGGTYSHPIADRVERLLELAGLDVTHDSVQQTTSDFSAVVAKAPPGAQVVFLPWQVGSRAAAFYDEFRKQGKTATFVGTDKLDGPEWLGDAEGQYLSSFADVKLLPSKYVSNVVSGYTSKYGDFKSSFGPPTFVATQVAAQAIHAACTDGKATRAEVLAKVRKSYLQTTILGYAMRFRASGDSANAKFYVYKIVGGKRKLVP